MPISRKLRRPDSGFLDGQLLIAMPAMTDKRFERTVIYMCAHSAEGAMGLIINRRAKHISFTELLEQLQIDGFPDGGDDLAVHVGGPVETGKGFVLHSSDYYAPESTLPIDGEVSLTATTDILKAMAKGRGPKHAFLALGYAGWSAGQLEREIHANGWLNCPADAELVFDTALPDKYADAMSKLGVNLTHLAVDAGHA
jgi:putative transcriptional regulator